MDSVYLDTTVPSYYHDSRKELAPKRLITREWWHSERPHYQLFISELVIQELQRAVFPHREAALKLLSEVPILRMTSKVEEVAAIYLTHHVMPRKDVGDAFHLAFASCYKIDFLLTWNCRHLANANKVRHIRVMNTKLGLFIPQLVTPEQLFMES